MAEDQDKKTEALRGLPTKMTLGPEYDENVSVRSISRLRAELEKERKSLDDERTKLAKEFAAREKSLIAQQDVTRETLAIREQDFDRRSRGSEERLSATLHEVEMQRQKASAEREGLKSFIKEIKAYPFPSGRPTC